MVRSAMVLSAMVLSPMTTLIRSYGRISKKSKDALDRQALSDKYEMELQKSVRKSGLQSDDPPSKFGLERVGLSKIEQEKLRSASTIGPESVDSPSKIEQERLRSASKIGSESVDSPAKIEQERLRSPSKVGPESVDSPPKDGLESFKSLPKSDPISHGDSTHTITPEIHVTLLICDRSEACRRSCIIKVDRDTTILELTHRVHQQTGVPLDQMKLFHDGRLVQDLWNDQDRLSACNINDSMTMALDLRDYMDRQMYLPTTPRSTTNVEAEDEVQATLDDYDEDLYIVDPQAHFDMLRQLERNVLQRSEYYQTKRDFSLSSALGPVYKNGFFLDEIGLDPLLTETIRLSSIMTQVSIHLVSIHISSRSPSKTLASRLRDIPMGDCWLIASRQVRKTHPHLQHSGTS